eukprot:3935025-Rhodomonas_salina.1
MPGCEDSSCKHHSPAQHLTPATAFRIADPRCENRTCSTIHRHHCKAQFRSSHRAAGEGYLHLGERPLDRFELWEDAQSQQAQGSGKSVNNVMRENEREVRKRFLSEGQERERKGSKGCKQKVQQSMYELCFSRQESEMRWKHAVQYTGQRTAHVRERRTFLKGHRVIP